VPEDNIVTLHTNVCPACGKSRHYSEFGTCNLCGSMICGKTDCIPCCTQEEPVTFDIGHRIVAATKVIALMMVLLSVLFDLTDLDQVVQMRRAQRRSIILELEDADDGKLTSAPPLERAA
jgi:hypothetical protein